MLKLNIVNHFADVLPKARFMMFYNGEQVSTIIGKE
tara:strand:- start:30263 stop:30370 length:108 start_codon:yes stop_codon:yes gene_type:complete